MYDIPIAIFPFRRPQLTERLFTIIAKVQPRMLLVYIDGPRDPQDSRLIKMTSDIFNRIDWDCELVVKTNERNLGLGSGYVEKIKWVFDQVNRAIFLEEDVIPDLTFFQYMQAMLDHFEGVEEVVHICGVNLMGESPTPDSYFLSKFPLPLWGWASWSRVMKPFDFNISDWESVIRSELRSCSIQPEFWERIFERAIKKRRTWDFPWLANILRGGNKVVVPAINLISNIGSGEEASYTKESTQYLNMKTYPMSFPIKHPVGYDRHLANQHEEEIIKWISGIMRNAAKYSLD